MATQRARTRVRIVRVRARTGSLKGSTMAPRSWASGDARATGTHFVPADRGLAVDVVAASPRPDTLVAIKLPFSARRRPPD